MRKELDVLEDIYKILDTYKEKVKLLMQAIYKVLEDINLKHNEEEEEILYFMRNVETEIFDEDDNYSIDDNYSDFQRIYSVLMTIYQLIELITTRKSNKFELLRECLENLNNKLMPDIKVVLDKNGDFKFKSGEILSKKVGENLITDILDLNNKSLVATNVYYIYHCCEIIQNSREELFRNDGKIRFLFESSKLEDIFNQILKIGEDASYNFTYDMDKLYNLTNDASDCISNIRVGKLYNETEKTLFLLQNLSFSLALIYDYSSIEDVIERRKAIANPNELPEDLINSLCNENYDGDDDDGNDDDDDDGNYDDPYDYGI